MTRALIVFFLMSTKVAYVQNLVPNPSFEEKAVCKPNDKKCFGPAEWYNPTYTTPDYFFEGNSNKSLNVPEGCCGYQEPLDGKAYAGIVVTQSGAEYLQVQLIKPLIKGKKYKLKFYCSLSKKSVMGIIPLGAMITQNPLTDMHYMTNIKAHIASTDTLFNTDWKPIEGIYTAKGGEIFLTIGLFKHGYQYFVKPFKKYTRVEIFYFIDDVSLISEEDDIIANEKQSANLSCTFEKVKPDSIKAGDVFELSNLLFESGSSVIQETSFEELTKLVELLQKQTSLQIEVAGHTDNNGKPADNLILSTIRAKAIADYLINKGISSPRITHKGYGDTKPVSDNVTDAGRKNNRRVEIVVLKK